MHNTHAKILSLFNINKTIGWHLIPELVKAKTLLSLFQNLLLKAELLLYMIIG